MEKEDIEYAVYYNETLIDLITTDSKDNALNQAQCNITVRRNKVK